MVMSRRALLAAALASGVPVSAALAQPAPGHFSSIQVDVGRLHALGTGPQADVLRAALLAALRQTFADRLGGSGPALVVRITGLSIRTFVGPSDRAGFSGGNSDYLEGEALVVGPRGSILARYPQLSALPSSSGGAWYDPASERRRLEALAQHYASWLRRTVPG